MMMFKHGVSKRGKSSCTKHITKPSSSLLFSQRFQGFSGRGAMTKNGSARLLPIVLATGAAMLAGHTFFH